MNTISYTAARNHLAQTMDEVCMDHAPIIITRGKSQPVVMMSLKDYQSIEETNYLLRNPNNAARLRDAVNEIEGMIKRRKK